MTSEALTAQVADWLRSQHQAVLATARKDGTPQTSNVIFWFDGSVARISVTTSRAKTANMLRHPRVVLHVLGESFWQYAAITCEAAISEPSTEPGDDVGRQLLELYEAVAPTPHPDPAEFFRVQVAEGRVVATLTPISVVATGLS